VTREWRPFRAHSIVTNVAEPLTGVYWEDLRFPATAIQLNPTTTHPALDTTIPGRLYRDGNTDTQIIIAQIPHAWREGSVLQPHVHWHKTTSAAGNVVWQLSYQWSSIGQPLSDAVTLEGSVPSVSDADTASVHALTRLGEISGAGHKVSDMLLMKLSRLGTDEDDTYEASARLIEFDIHYQVSSPGSRQEFIK
jgi:hypothetical protein